MLPSILPLQQELALVGHHAVSKPCCDGQLLCKEGCSVERSTMYMNMCTACPAAQNLKGWMLAAGAC